MASLVAPLQCDGREVINEQVVQVRGWLCAPWVVPQGFNLEPHGGSSMRTPARTSGPRVRSQQPAVVFRARCAVMGAHSCLHAVQPASHSELSGSVSPARRRRARHVRRACGPGHTHGACPPSTRRRTRRDCTHEATTKVLLDSEAKLERTRNAHTPVCILHRLRRRSTATASTLTHANSRTASLGHPGRSG